MFIGILFIAALFAVLFKSGGAAAVTNAIPSAKQVSATAIPTLKK